MNEKELREVFDTEEEIEYHVMGNETDEGGLLSIPGWYPCIVTWLYRNGDAEIGFTSPDLDTVGVTVLKKNFAIAFRRMVGVQA